MPQTNVQATWLQNEIHRTMTKIINYDNKYNWRDLNLMTKKKQKLQTLWE